MRPNKVKLTLNGETHTVKEWAKIKNLKEHTIYSRILYNWTDEQILTTGVSYGNHSKRKSGNITKI